MKTSFDLHPELPELSSLVDHVYFLTLGFKHFALHAECIQQDITLRDELQP